MCLLAVCYYRKALDKKRTKPGLPDQRFREKKGLLGGGGGGVLSLAGS